MIFSDLLLLTVFFEILAFLFGILNYKKIKNSKEKYFIYLLFYTFINELIGNYFIYFEKVNFSIIYQVFAIISFLFYNWWFNTILISSYQKLIIKLGSIIFIILSIYNLISYSWDEYHYTTFLYGAFILILSALFYFAQLLNDKEEIDVIYNLRFWITTGLLLFHVGMIPLTLFSEQFDGNNEIRIIILVTLNLILYACYSIGFILCKPIKD